MAWITELSQAFSTHIIPTSVIANCISFNEHQPNGFTNTVNTFILKETDKQKKN